MAKTTNEYWTYLEGLRRSGETNMFCATPYLTSEFPELTQKKAQAILIDWIQHYNKEDYE